MIPRATLESKDFFGACDATAGSVSGPNSQWTEFATVLWAKWSGVSTGESVHASAIHVSDCDGCRSSHDTESSRNLIVDDNEHADLLESIVHIDMVGEAFHDCSSANHDALAQITG